MCKHVICEQLWFYHISYVKVIHAIDARMLLSMNYLPQYMHPTHTHTHTHTLRATRQPAHTAPAVAAGHATAAHTYTAMWLQRLPEICSYITE